MNALCQLVNTAGWGYTKKTIPFNLADAVIWSLANCHGAFLSVVQDGRSIAGGTVAVESCHVQDVNPYIQDKGKIMSKILFHPLVHSNIYGYQ